MRFELRLLRLNCEQGRMEGSVFGGDRREGSVFGGDRGEGSGGDLMMWRRGDRGRCIMMGSRCLTPRLNMGMRSRLFVGVGEDFQHRSPGGRFQTSNLSYRRGSGAGCFAVLMARHKPGTKNGLLFGVADGVQRRLLADGFRASNSRSCGKSEGDEHFVKEGREFDSPRWGTYRTTLP